MTTPDDDLTAAEYALGTLAADERAAATARRSRDAAFDAAVIAWEDRLAALSEAAAERDPPPGVWSAILERLDLLARPAGVATAADGNVVMLRRQVARWRGGFAATSALAAALALWIASAPQRDSAGRPELVAFLQASPEPPAYVVDVSLRDDRLAVRPVSAAAPAGRAYELWVIDPSLGAPRSLGVLEGAVTTHRLPAGVGGEVLARATFAVTLEQAGGSPTGSPTGAPAFSGHLVQAPR